MSKENCDALLPHEIMNAYLNFELNDLRRIIFLIYKVDRIFISFDHIINLLRSNAEILVVIV